MTFLLYGKLLLFLSRVFNYFEQKVLCAAAYSRQAINILLNTIIEGVVVMKFFSVIEIFIVYSYELEIKISLKFLWWSNYEETHRIQTAICVYVSLHHTFCKGFI